MASRNPNPSSIHSIHCQNPSLQFMFANSLEQINWSINWSVQVCFGSSHQQLVPLLYKSAAEESCSLLTPHSLPLASILALPEGPIALYSATPVKTNSLKTLASYTLCCTRHKTLITLLCSCSFPDLWIEEPPKSTALWTLFPAPKNLMIHTLHVLVWMFYYIGMTCSLTVFNVKLFHWNWISGASAAVFQCHHQLPPSAPTGTLLSELSVCSFCHLS